MKKLRKILLSISLKTFIMNISEVKLILTIELQADLKQFLGMMEMLL